MLLSIIMYLSTWYDCIMWGDPVVIISAYRYTVCYKLFIMCSLTDGRVCWSLAISYFDQTLSLHACLFLWWVYITMLILLVSLICCTLCLYANVTPESQMEVKTWVSLFDSKATLMLLWLTVIESNKTVCATEKNVCPFLLKNHILGFTGYMFLMM